MHNIEALLQQLTNWARPAGVEGAALVGSHARGQARPDSDVDLVLLVANPEDYLTDHEWLRTFREPAHVTREHWGAVQALRVRYRGGLEVEFGIATPDWAQTAPLDPGTARVVSKGCRVLYDPCGILGALVIAVAARPVEA